MRYMYTNIVDYVLGKFNILSNILAFLPANDVFNVLVPVAIVLGIGIGIVGTLFAVHKHANV